MKFLKVAFISVLSALLLVYGTLLFLQSRWTKDQLVQVLQELALQSGVRLSIEKIEGQLPLQWTFKGVELILPLSQDATVTIDYLQIRLALLPLLRGHVGVSYLHAGPTKIAYVPEKGKAASGKQRLKKIKGSFSIKSATLDEVTLLNRLTNQQMSYSAKARGRWLKNGKSFLAQVTAHSTEMDLNVFCKGSKRLNHMQISCHLTARSNQAFAPFYTPSSELAFEIASQAEGPWMTWKSLLFEHSAQASPPIAGTLDIHVSHLAFADINLPLEPFQLSSKFSVGESRGWDLSHLAILSPSIQLQGSAQFSPEGLPHKLHTSLVIADLSHFSKMLKGQAQGEIDLQDEKCHLQLNIPTFTLDGQTFSQGKLELLGQIQNEIWTAAVQMEASHPTLGCRASSELYWTPQQVLEIKALDMQSKSGRISGDVSIYHRDDIRGGISFQMTDLAPLSPLIKIDLAGQAGGEILFEGNEIHARSLGKHLRVNQFISDRVDIDIEHLKLSTPLQGSLKLTSDAAYFREVYFSSFLYQMGYDAHQWNYHMEAQGQWKGAFDILTQGSLRFSSGNLELSCKAFSGKILNKPIHLQKTCIFKLGDKTVKIQDLELVLDQGRLAASSHWDPKSAFLTLHAEHLPLDFLTILTPRFSLQGLSSIDIDLQADNNNLQGHVNLLLEHADIYPAGNVKPIQTKGSVQLNISHNKLQLYTHLVATHQQLCDISLTIPICFHLDPLTITCPPSGPIAGQCTLEGYTEQLFDFINLGSQRVGGLVSTHLLLSGTVENPILHGPLTVQGGFYENYFIGIAVKDAHVEAQAQGHELVVHKAVTTDGEKGSSESTATFYLRKGLPFSVQGTLQHFKVIRFDWLTGACSGPFTIEGDLSGALAKGKLTLDEADVTIPDQLPSELPVLPITFIHEPESHVQNFDYSTPYPFRYDLDVYGDHDLRLNGRGIEAELEGSIQMTGQNLSVIASGALHTKKGKFSFAGKDFIINQGEILFSGEKSFLNITSTVEYPSLAVTVHFRGDLRSPQLIFESNPPLPTSSILARILFNKDVSELSAAQALQLANTIVTLSGSSGPNVLESIRKNLGIDRLSISANEETGSVSVQIGKYITQGVMISLAQSTESSQVKVEVELKAGFILEAETQENNQGKFSFKWNRNY